MPLLGFSSDRHARLGTEQTLALKLYMNRAPEFINYMYFKVSCRSEQNPRRGVFLLDLVLVPG